MDVRGRKWRAACPQRGKAQQRKREWHGPERQRRSKAAHGQENLQNVERSMVEHWSGEDRYA